MVEHKFFHSPPLPPHLFPPTSLYMNIHCCMVFFFTFRFWNVRMRTTSFAYIRYTEKKNGICLSIAPRTWMICKMNVDKFDFHPKKKQRHHQLVLLNNNNTFHLSYTTQHENVTKQCMKTITQYKMKMVGPKIRSSCATPHLKWKNPKVCLLPSINTAHTMVQWYNGKNGKFNFWALH